MPSTADLPRWTHGAALWLDTVADEFDRLYPGHNPELVLAIARHIAEAANKNTGRNCLLTAKTIANRLDCTTRDVLASLETLEDLRLLSAYKPAATTNHQPHWAPIPASDQTPKRILVCHNSTENDTDPD